MNSTAQKIAQNYQSLDTVKPVLPAIEVKRPTDSEFFRAHPDPEFAFLLLTFISDHVPTHVVSPNLIDELENAPIKRKLLTTVITNYGEIKLMPLPHKYKDRYSKTAHRAIELSKAEWMQMKYSSDNYNYLISTSSRVIPPPVWPDVTPEEVFQAAFQNHYISDMNHPAINYYKGMKHVA